MTNAKKSRNSAYRYSRTSCYYADNTVKKVNDNYITNPIKTDYKNAYNMLTKTLSYFKTKYQHKHYDKCSTPYNIRMDRVGNSYLVFSDIHDVKIDDDEKSSLEKCILFVLDFLSENSIKLTCNIVKRFILSIDDEFYFNDIDLSTMIRQYKKQNAIKHRTDNECLVFRPKKSTISKGAKKLGAVVK